MFQVLFLRFLFLACDDCEYFLRKRNLHQMNNYLLRLCSTLKQICHKLNTMSCASILMPLSLGFKCWCFSIFLSYWDVKCDTCPMGIGDKKKRFTSSVWVLLNSQQNFLKGNLWSLKISYTALAVRYETYVHIVAVAKKNIWPTATLLSEIKRFKNKKKNWSVFIYRSNSNT